MVSTDKLPTVAIRAALPADIDTLAKLARETFHETFAADNKEEDMQQYLSQNFSREAIADELQYSGSIVFIAEVDGEAAGYARVVLNDYLEPPVNRYAMEVQRLYVKQEYHGHKIGYSLMQHCISHAKMNGAKTLWLGVWERNSKAIDFYTRIGFTRTGEHPFTLGKDIQTDWIMELAL